MGRALWKGIEFSRIRVTEWGAGQLASGRGIKAMSHDGIVTYVSPRRVRRQAVIDLDDDRLGQSLNEQLKFCGQCAEWYPASPNYFHLQSGGKYGLSNVCIGCKRGYDRDRYDKRVLRCYNSTLNS